jgi:hypothetical protein
MATFQSDLATGQSYKGDSRIDGRLLSGKVRQCNAVVTVPAGLTTSDVVEVVTLPQGSLINLAECYVVTESLGSTLTATLACEGAGSDLASSIDLSSAGKVDFDADGGLYTVAAGEEKVSMTIDSAASAVVGATARVVITYIDRN